MPNVSQYAGSASGSGWTNPGNATGAPDSNYATEAISAGNAGTAILLETYGFAIPTNATILGIVAVATRTATGATIDDLTVRLLKAGSPVGSNYASSNSWLTTPQTYGTGTTDLWGTTWTPSDINNSGFGITITPQNTNAKTLGTAELDAVQITVYYSAPAAQCVGPVIVALPVVRVLE
jgi:hypothetical protein